MVGIANCMGSAERYLGLLATTLGDHPAAEVHFDAAIERNALGGLDHVFTMVRADYARMLEARGGPADALRAAQLRSSRRPPPALNRRRHGCRQQTVCRSVCRSSVVLITLVLAAPASASDFSWPIAYTSQAKNPADALADLPIEDATYDPATHCSKKAKPGMTALVEWLTSNAGGAFWGTYRCEKWGPHSASLHAENRAVDWALDVDVPAQRKEAERLIALFLAPDKLGQPQALARRMGVEEIIWDCGYWGAGMQTATARTRRACPSAARSSARSTRRSRTATTCTSG